MTSASHRLIGLRQRADWEAALRNIPHAFAHTWSSCHAMALTTRLPTFLYVWEHGESRVVCAVSERGDGDDVDVVTPYGFGGFTGSAAGTRFLDDWIDLAEERGYVCGYIGLNPLLAVPGLSARDDFAAHNEVHVLNLALGEEALRRSLSVNRRRELAGFDRDGFRVVDDAPRLGSFFLRHIGDFLSSRQASSAYDLSSATWQALVEGDQGFLLGAETAAGEVVAACLFASTPYCGEYLFSVTAPGGEGCTTALLWAGMSRLAAEGVPWFNLGGGVRPGDGIEGYKRRFGGEALPLGALRQVYRPDRFAELCARAGITVEQTPYFPPYRLPRTAPRGTVTAHS
jgi:hypothetical protein